MKADFLPTRLVPDERVFGKDGFRSKGFGKASAATKQRWRSDGCRLSTYQYEEKALLWHEDTWRHPCADELDILPGFLGSFTAVPSLDEEARERLLGNTIHLGCIEGLLQDFPTGKEPVPSMVPLRKHHRQQHQRNRHKPPCGGSLVNEAPFPQQAPVKMMSKAIPLASAVWKCCQQGQLFDIPDEDLRPRTPKDVRPTCRWGDVEQRRETAEDNEFLPPDCKGLSPCEFMERIWDFKTRTPKCSWPSGTKGIHPFIQACYDHMVKMDEKFEGWMEARLLHWEKRASAHLRNNPNWRQDLPPSVEAVLPKAYNPFVHRELLQAAEADLSMVDIILKGFTLSGPQPPTGFFEPLAACKAQDLVDVDNALKAALQ